MMDMFLQRFHITIKNAQLKFGSITGRLMMAKPVLVARKWNGDDAYSWAIFVKGENAPVIAGLHKREVNGYKKIIMAEIMKETGHE
jgi:hypothetical protein